MTVEETTQFIIRDGIDEIRHELGTLMRLIVDTTKWVNPKTFHALPVWYPETARRQRLYNAAWTEVYRNKNRETGIVDNKKEPNIKASKAFARAIGVDRVDGCPTSLYALFRRS